MNPNHDEKGKFSSSGGGAAVGDHQREQNAPTRNVPGHGRVPHSQVIARHSHAESVGTSVRLDNANSPAIKTGMKGSAKQERVAMRQQVDERHMPTRSNTDVAAMTDQSRPMAGLSATAGRFKMSTSAANAATNKIMRASGSPSVNRPTAGQMVAAKIINPQ
jgi:hypothetical protein